MAKPKEKPTISQESSGRMERIKASTIKEICKKLTEQIERNRELLEKTVQQQKE